MRILFISDKLFTRHEREMIARLAVGLADEGLTVAWAVPEKIAANLNNQVLLPVLPIVQNRLGLTPARRAAALLTKARAVLRGDPDVVHFFGGGVARIGAEVTRLANAVPAFELWRPGLEPSIRVAINRVYGAGAAKADDAGRALIVTPNDDARARATKAFPDALVRTIPWGVYPVSDSPTRNAGTVCLLLLGPGRDSKAWQSAFRAAVRSAQSSKHVHIFADAQTTRRLKLWAHASQAGVLDRLTLFDESATRRDLMLQADVLIQPDARGELSTILLDAMAASVAVLASADPQSVVLIDGKTARLVVDATVQQWHEAIEMVINNDSARRKLTESAREYVRAEHKASRQTESLVDAYEWVGGEAVRIESAPMFNAH